jgi:hypothetical protein
MYILKFPSFSNPLSFQGMISRILMYADTAIGARLADLRDRDEDAE